MREILFQERTDLIGIALEEAISELGQELPNLFQPKVQVPEFQYQLEPSEVFLGINPVPPMFRLDERRPCSS